MKNIFLAIITLSSFSLASCLTSVHPLTTPETIVSDNRITGQWMNDDQVINIEPFMQSQFSKELQRSLGKEKAFHITGDKVKDSLLFNNLYLYSTQLKNNTYYMGGGLVKLGNNVFAELYPLSLQDSNNEDPFSFNNNFLPSYTIAKLEWNGNGQMIMKFIDGDFITEQVKQGRMRLKHEKDELFGTFTITASTQELQQFLQKYGNDERVFNKTSTVVMKRKPVL